MEKDTVVHSRWPLLNSWVPVGLVYLLSHGVFEEEAAGGTGADKAGWEMMGYWWQEASDHDIGGPHM